MKVSLVQTNPQPDRARNLDETRALMEEAYRAEGPDLIVLPEYFEAYGLSVAEKLAMAEPAGGAAYRMASDFAREHRVFVHAGTIMEKVENEARIWNTSFVFDRSGREVAAYRKIHMFDIVAPDGSVYRESDSVKPGGEIVTYDIEGLKVGCAICYDIASRNSSCAWRKRAATSSCCRPRSRCRPARTTGRCWPRRAPSRRRPISLPAARPAR